MRIFLATLFLTATFVCCQPEEVAVATEASTFQEARLWNNGLSVDGCDYRISIRQGDAWIEYAPDPESRALVEQFVTKQLDFTNDYHGYRTVTVKGTTQTKLRTINCGWGHTKQLPEISIADIQK